MQTPLSTILNLLIESPGNIIYHLALAFSIVSSFQTALLTRKSRNDSDTNRLMLGLGMLLFGQIVLFFSSGLAWQNVLDGRAFLPPLDRAIALFSLIWVTWLWAFPKPSRLGDLFGGFLNLGVVILFLFTYSSWNQEAATQHFNTIGIDQIWAITSCGVAVIGLAILFFSRTPGWGFGAGMLSIILAGNIAHLLLSTSDKDFSGYIRLAYLAAFPLLPTLLNRLSSTTVSSETARTLSDPSLATPIPYPRTKERRRYSADPRTVHAWLSLSTAVEPDQILSGITRSLAHTMLSDICFLVSEPKYGQITLQSGYDLIREESIPGNSLDQNQLPSLTTALQRGKSLSITPDDVQPDDLHALSAALGIEEIGTLLFLPLLNTGKPQGGILFLSPYSKRIWNADDQGFLNSELEIINKIIQGALQSPIKTAPSAVIDRASESLRAELESLRHDNQLLLLEMSEYRQKESNVVQGIADSDINALVALQQESQEQLITLQTENERLHALLISGERQNIPTGDLGQLEAELRQSLQDIAALHNQVAEANARNIILESEIRKNERPTTEDLEVITSVVQEIRQPMASINGYTELLLSESVGILGALQRKFLERILASTERLRSILDDLIRVTTISEGPVELIPQPVELVDIIDGAVTDMSAQLREKNIGMRVDLPEDMPQIYADRDAIQQIIVHLLQNAGTATPQENTITLRARVQQDDGNDFLLVQVTDNGGGIRSEDLPRVFSRRYRAEKPLIQGLGDTGVGLSIAKTLVEAHGGRIWVDSMIGQGATFSVLLPLQPTNNGRTMK